MKLSRMEKKLYDEFESIKVIDAHEHLAPERERIKRKMDVVCLFAWPYTGTDLTSAGMPQKSTETGWGLYSTKTYEYLIDSSVPLRERWKLISPFIKHIRYGSYARAVYLSVKEFYGFDDINDENYEEISEAISKVNTAGIYTRILKEKCNIETTLTQAGRTDFDLDLLVPLMPGTMADLCTKKQITPKLEEFGEKTASLDDYLSLVKESLVKWKSERVVGVKILSRNYPETNESKARTLFNRIMKDPRLELPSLNLLQSYVLDQMLEMCADLDLVVAVHTGMWGDFRELDAKFMIPILQRHPRTRFDLYHMGMPAVRDMAIIGKNFPNAWLNLCWSHVISQQMTVSALDEWIDLIPVNKIVAFGGDYGTEAAECIYGHLVMARENIARILARRIKDGLMTFEDSVSLAENWFYSVPKELYRL